MKPTHTLDRVSDTSIRITRQFRAQASLVYDCWTKPEYLRRWWAPLTRGVSMLECDADLRPGGAYRYVLGGPAHGTFAFSGTYRELTRPTRLVYTQRFEPMPGEAVITVSFEERDGATTVVADEVYPSKEALEGALATGMEDGMRETYAQLDELLAAQGSGRTPR